MYHLCRIRGFFYFRIKVPADVVSLLKLKEIKKSLHTKVLRDAKVISKSFGYKLERIFTLARCGMLSDIQIAKLLTEFKHKTLRELEDDRIQGGGLITSKEIEDSEEGYGAYYEGCDTARDILREALLANDLKSIEPSVDDLLAVQSISLDKGSIQYKKVCREMLKVWVAIYGIEMERTIGNYDNDYDRLIKHMLLQQTEQPSQPIIEVDNHRKTKPAINEQTVRVLMDSFMKEKQGNGGWGSSKTSMQYDRAFRLFEFILGSRDIKAYDREDMINFRDILQKLPKNLFNRKEYRDKAIKQVMRLLHEKKATKTLSIKTCNEYMIAIGAFFGWCIEWNHTSYNPAVNLLKKDPEKVKDKRHMYDREDLRRLLRSSIYTTSTRWDKPIHFFGSLILLFTGCRLGEMCQLHTEDIREVEGVLCFDIRYRSEQERLKSEASERIIPLHPQLVEAGLLKYLERKREQGQDRLWPNLHYTRNNGWAGATGKWLRENNRDHITQNPKKTPHSFRHTFVTNLREHGVSEEIVIALDGHKKPNESMTSKVYDKSRIPVKVLYEAILKLDYGLDFASIRFRAELMDK